MVDRILFPLRALLVVFIASGCGSKSRSQNVEGEYVSTSHYMTVSGDTGQLLLTVRTNKFKTKKTPTSVSLEKKPGGEGYTGNAGGFIGEVSVSFSEGAILAVVAGEALHGKKIRIEEGRSILTKSDAGKVLAMDLREEAGREKLGGPSTRAKDRRRDAHTAELFSTATVSTGSVGKAEGRTYDRYHITGTVALAEHRRKVEDAKTCAKRSKKFFSSKCTKYKTVNLSTQTVAADVPFAATVDMPRFTDVGLKPTVIWEEFAARPVHHERWGWLDLHLTMGKIMKKSLRYKEVEIAAP